MSSTVMNELGNDIAGSLLRVMTQVSILGQMLSDDFGCTQDIGVFLAGVHAQQGLLFAGLQPDRLVRGELDQLGPQNQYTVLVRQDRIPRRYGNAAAGNRYAEFAPHAQRLDGNRR